MIWLPKHQLSSLMNDNIANHNTTRAQPLLSSELLAKIISTRF